MNENKLERLDTAFLFIVSFVGLVITIVQVSIFEKANLRGLVEIIPLLFLGIVIPFYVGYLRGAISIVFTNRSIVERMRGWVYLIMGVSGYFGYVFSSGQTNLLKMWATFYSIGLVGLGLTFLLQRWFINVFDVGDKTSHQYSFFGTIVSAYFFPFVLRMLVSLYSDLSARPQFSPLLVSLLVIFIWITLGIAMVSLVFEKVSRNIIDSVDINHLGRCRHRNFVVKLFLLNLDVYRFVFNENTNLQAFVSWWMGLIFGALGVFLFAISHIPIFPEAFLIVSIFFLGLGTLLFWRMRRIDFSKLGK